MVDNFFTIEGEETKEKEIVEKKSRFIAQIIKITSEEEANKKILEIKKKHRDAKHNVFAYRIVNGIEKFSDDGEPSGTAGVPILDILRGEKLENILLVVTRYFGGILLGTGGLVRAYSSAAKEAHRRAGEPRCPAHHNAPRAEAMARTGVWKGSRTPEIERSLLRLKMKFTRWVTRKLRKYPSIPQRGSRTYRNATSMAEVRML